MQKNEPKLSVFTSTEELIIPLDQVSDEAIENLVAEYCLRDWGLNETEMPLIERKNQVKAALKRGELVIVYSQHLETAQLVDTNAFNSDA